MRLFVRLVSVFIIAFLFSCEEQGFLVNCQECVLDEPENTSIDVKLEWSNISFSVVKLYEGNLEDNVLVGTFDVVSGTLSHSVSLNKKYTLTATYLINGSTYTAVDAVTPRVRYNKDQCDDPCYFVYNKSADLRLKYTK
jgi:hypothetical protein